LGTAVDPMQRAPAPGATIQGRYRLIRLVGAGGMGQVFEAEDTFLQRRVALKAIHRALDPVGLRRLWREARVTAQLDHPNIVQLIDFVEGPPPFIVMELLEGESLFERLRREGRLDAPTACSFAMQVLSALQAAHEKGIVHRDLKPANVFLVKGQAGTLAKVLDFGIAKQIAGSEAVSTGGHEVMGSAPYMSPQQLRGEPAEPRADIFAVGSVLYEMLTGRRAFDGANPEQIVLRILQDAPIAPLAGVADDLAAVVLRALSHDRDGRYSTAAQMREALRPFSEGAPGLVSAPEGRMVSTSAPTADHTYAPPAPPPPRARRRRAASEPVLARRATSRSMARWAALPVALLGVGGGAATLLHFARTHRVEIPVRGGPDVASAGVSSDDAGGSDAPVGSAVSPSLPVAAPSAPRAIEVSGGAGGPPRARPSRRCTSGADCGPEERCERGQCSCPSGAVACGGRCVDIAHDVENCGACGARCKNDEMCSAPLTQARCIPCGSANSPGTVACEPHRCVDPQLNNDHCGACGHRCQAGTQCGEGVCEVPAALGKPCRFHCADPNARCDVGGCVCRTTAGFRECNGVCAKSCDAGAPP
jgi:serine/threonine-protein kinase